MIGSIVGENVTGMEHLFIAFKTLVKTQSEKGHFRINTKTQKKH